MSHTSLPRSAYVPVLEDIPHITLAERVRRAVARDIRRGHLKPGERLPGSRSLARSLDVSRTTVNTAYRWLEAEGWLQSQSARGFFVDSNIPAAANEKKGGFELDTRYALPKPDDASPLKPTVEDGMTRWDYGIPDTRIVPFDELARSFARELRREPKLLEYADNDRLSDTRLERALLQRLTTTRSISAQIENLVVTRGSQMAIYLLAQTLVRPGDVVAVENPGYPFVWTTFRAAGADIAPIPVDRGGIDVEQVEALAKNGSLRAVFVTPHHQFPTTRTLPASARLRLLSLAAEFNFVIIEDDYDHAFHYEGAPVPPIAASEMARNVVYIASLSKIFAPGLRVGFVAAPEVIARAMRAHRRLIDLQGDIVLERAVADLLEEGLLQRHLNHARRIFVRRRDTLCRLLDKQLKDELRFEVPSGGMAIWAETHKGVDVEKWQARAYARGLSFQTGKMFDFHQRPIPFMRLGFARLDEDELANAVGTLAETAPTLHQQRRSERRSTSLLAPRNTKQLPTKDAE